MSICQYTSKSCVYVTKRGLTNMQKKTNIFLRCEDLRCETLKFGTNGHQHTKTTEDEKVYILNNE